jgi:hypothetical protein
MEAQRRDGDDGDDGDDGMTESRPEEETRRRNDWEAAEQLGLRD